jgi:hypothetical protein
MPRLFEVNYKIFLPKASLRDRRPFPAQHTDIFLWRACSAVKIQYLILEMALVNNQNPNGFLSLILLSLNESFENI